MDSNQNFFNSDVKQAVNSIPKNLEDEEDDMIEVENLLTTKSTREIREAIGKEDSSLIDVDDINNWSVDNASGSNSQYFEKKYGLGEDKGKEVVEFEEFSSSIYEMKGYSGEGMYAFTQGSFRLFMEEINYLLNDHLVDFGSGGVHIYKKNPNKKTINISEGITKVQSNQGHESKVKIEQARDVTQVETQVKTIEHGKYTMSDSANEKKIPTNLLLEHKGKKGIFVELPGKSNSTPSRWYFLENCTSTDPTFVWSLTTQSPLFSWRNFSSYDQGKMRIYKQD